MVEQTYNYGLQLETTSIGIDITGRTETDTLNVSGISTFNNDVTFVGTYNAYGISLEINLNLQIMQRQHLVLVMTYKFIDGANSYV